MADEKELKHEEMEQASGGLRFARAERKPDSAGTVVPTEPVDEGDDGGPTPTIGDVTPLPDPPHHA